MVFVHSPGHPVRRCAGPPFWPACCLSPGRSEPCACRWRPQPRPALTLRFLPTVGSRRSRRRAAWSLRVTYSFRIKEPELKKPEISKKKKKNETTRFLLNSLSSASDKSVDKIRVQFVFFVFLLMGKVDFLLTSENLATFLSGSIVQQMFIHSYLIF